MARGGASAATNVLDLIRRGGFRFAAAESPEGKERRNPWLLRNLTDSDAIPVVGEANTVTWMLKSKLGGELEVPNERGEMVKTTRGTIIRY